MPSCGMPSRVRYSTHASSCRGLESIRTPSMSKITPRIIPTRKTPIYLGLYAELSLIELFSQPWPADGSYMAERVLSQEEIDSVFRRLQDTRNEDDPAKRAQPYDFRRPDRIAKDQLRAIHLLRENFARSLASSLSAYLRAYVMVNLV
ncbi:MAG: hypothetical protein FJW32_23590, partial [Acidobacteria bacterium]|nr:hypothetical protein [Acidobacteriota bacterium]